MGSVLTAKFAYGIDDGNSEDGFKGYQPWVLEDSGLPKEIQSLGQFLEFKRGMPIEEVGELRSWYENPEHLLKSIWYGQDGCTGDVIGVKESYFETDWVATRIDPEDLIVKPEWDVVLKVYCALIEKPFDPEIVGWHLMPLYL